MILDERMKNLKLAYMFFQHTLSKELFLAYTRYLYDKSSCFKSTFIILHKDGNSMNEEKTSRSRESER
jgi:hypothetical protein